MQSFLIVINKWWTIVNSKTRFSANPLASAIVKDDGKVEFSQSLDDWFSSWSKTRSKLCLPQQTFQAMMLTLQAHMGDWPALRRLRVRYSSLISK